MGEDGRATDPKKKRRDRDAVVQRRLALWAPRLAGLEASDHKAQAEAADERGRQSGEAPMWYYPR
jgi:hypothetical protein